MSVARSGFLLTVPRMALAGAVLVAASCWSLALDHDVMLSVYQGPCTEGDFAANLATKRKVIAQAREPGSDCVVPEALLSGYESRPKVGQSARPLSDPDLRQPLTDFRRPTSDADLRFWLDNMVRVHRFSPGEVSAATGLNLDEISEAMKKWSLNNALPPNRSPGEPLRVLPYPGGRHPRIGFLEGAIMPQRETKVSVFTPWDDASYVVVDVPEAIFSSLGLTYLAHTHIPTIWDQQGVKLPRLEWNRRADGTLDSERTLPNGIAFGARVAPSPTEVRMELWLRNGTPEKLTGLRVQNCVMLKMASGFAAQTLTNKVFKAPYAAVRSEDGRRWIITAWAPVQRCWGNDQCPCLHSDPQFPDCGPGETQRLRGWLSFFEGTAIEGEFKRLEETGWRKGP